MMHATVLLLSSLSGCDMWLETTLLPIQPSQGMTNNMAENGIFLKVLLNSSFP